LSACGGIRASSTGTPTASAWASRISRRKPWMLMRSYASVTVVNSAQTRQRGS
jgi:hypothetical protein